MIKVLENRIPPPIVATLFGVAMWWCAPAPPEAGNATTIIAAGAAALLGLVFCLAGVIEFRRAQTTVNPLKPDTASSLVSSGIYRLTRNPMYVGFTLFLVAWTIWLAWPWALLGVAGYVLYIDRLQIVPEERAMRALFGEEFNRYAQQVRRWL